MESSDQKFYYPSDERFSSIFNGNIPSLVIKIEISQIPQSPFQNIECLQENITETVSGKEKEPTSTEDIPNSVNKIERQIYAPQICESSFQNGDSLQEISVASVPTIPQREKESILEENFTNGVKENKLKTDASRIPQSPPQNIEYLKEVHDESVPDSSGKIKRPISNENFLNVNNKSESLPQDNESLQEVFIESIPTTLQKGKKSISDENFLNAVEEIKLQIDANQKPESLLQTSEYLKEVPVESVSSILGTGKRSNPDEVFPNAVKRMKREIDINQMSELPTNNVERLQEVSVESVPTILQKKRRSIFDENFSNAVEEIKLQIGASQKPESLLQTSEYLKEVHVESVPSISGTGKNPNPDEDFPNAVKRMKREIDANQISELSTKDDKSLQEVSVESVPTISQEQESVNPDENVTNSMKEIKMQIGASQKPESWLQNSERLKEVHVEYVPSISGTGKMLNADELFPNVVKRMKREIDTNQISELPTKGDESLEVSVESAPALSQKEKSVIPDENFTNSTKEIKMLIGASQILELMSENNKYLKEVSIESAPSISEMIKRPKPEEDSANAVKRIKREVNANQIPEPPTKDDERLQEVSVESVPTISRKKKRRNLDKDFKSVLKKIHRQHNPKVPLTSLAVEIMNSLNSHFIELFDEELNILKKIRKVKTLKVKQIEYATRLCLPQVLQSRTMAYGRLAVQRALEKTE